LNIGWIFELKNSFFLKGFALKLSQPASSPELNRGKIDAYNDRLRKKILLILYDFWVKNSSCRSDQGASITFREEGRQCMIFF
jgi:hypothetical protein